MAESEGKRQRVAIAMHTISSIAEKLSVSERTVRRLIRSGKLSAINVGLGSQRQDLRITESALEDFIRGSAVIPNEKVSRKKEAYRMKWL